MTKSLAELEQELADHLNRAKYLEGAIREAEGLIKTLKDEHRKILGGYPGGGLIGSTEQEIHRAKLAIEDEMLTSPVLTKEPHHEQEYRVTRVTPKRVYFRAKGGGVESYVNLDGTGQSYSWWVGYKGMDIKATIARFEEAKKNGK